MKYNVGDFKSPEKKAKSLVFFLSVAFAIFTIIIIGIFILFVYLGIATVNLEAIVALIALVVSLSTILITFVEKTYERFFSTKKIIDIKVEIQDHKAIFWGQIGNLGRKRIYNKNVYLVVSRGKLCNGLYNFELPLEHEDDNGNISHLEDYCIYSKLMHNCQIEDHCSLKNNLDIINQSSEFDQKLQEIVKRYNLRVGKEEYHRIFVYRGLSKQSRLFVDPGEEFTDEIVLDLMKGVYRALIIWMPEGHEDCACSLKYINIES